MAIAENRHRLYLQALHLADHRGCGRFHWPEQPIEALIAFSILVSAIPAIRPLFPEREAYIAAGFGLIHGMSLAVVPSGFHLVAVHFPMSIFGFDTGIEAMQLIVAGATVPWLILRRGLPLIRRSG